MELTLFQLRDLDGKAVVIASSNGTAIATGKIKVVDAPHKIVQPSVMAEFMFENAPASRAIPSDRLAEVASSWGDGHFTFILPADVPAQKKI